MTDPNYDPTVSDWSNRYDVAENPMLHGIDETVEGGAFASVRAPAWHKLGVVVEAQCTALELLQAAHCDFPIFQGPIQTSIGIPLFPDTEDSVTVPMTAVDNRRYNICRLHPTTGDLQILGQASKDYPLWTPREVLVGFGDAILGQAKPNVSTCGALDEGRQTFMSFELPQDIRVGGMADEQVRLWLVVHTSFDQSKPTTATITPIRTVCANTLRVGMQRALSQFRIKKTKNADLQAAQARSALKLVERFRTEMTRRTDALVTMPFTTDQFVAMIERFWAPDEDAAKNVQTRWQEKKGQLVALFTTADTQANVRGTAYGALQAITEDRDWFSKVQGKKGEPKPDEDEVRFRRSVIEGEKSVTEPKELVAKYLLELAGV